MVGHELPLGGLCPSGEVSTNRDNVSQENIMLNCDIESFGKSTSAGETSYKSNDINSGVVVSDHSLTPRQTKRKDDDIPTKSVRERISEIEINDKNKKDKSLSKSVTRNKILVSPNKNKRLNKSDKKFDSEVTTLN